jgi:inner membrane protein
VDNLTHTLVGLALAESGLKHRTRFATATLLLGANLPDIDGFMYFLGSGTDALAFRRGWTHGVLAMIVLPLLLAALMLGLARLRHRGRDAAQQRIDPPWLLALAVIAIVSHPLLDLLNTYGVRLLMPFSGRWFYADALFIVDPWLWLALIGGVILTRHRARRAATGDPARAYRPVRLALAASATYVLIMAASSRLGRAVVEAQADGLAARRTLVSPAFLTPLRRRVVRDLGREYEVGELSWGPRPRYQANARDPVGLDEPGARLAAATPDGAAFLGWARFPYFYSQRLEDRVAVLIGDMRYGRGPGGSWASVRIDVPARPPGSVPTP